MPKCKLISFVSGKGGVGKTNFCVGVASILASTGKKVLLVDFDLSMANINVLYRVHNDKGLQELVGDKKVEDVVSNIRKNLYFIMTDSDQELKSFDIDLAEYFIKKIRDYTKDFDYCLMDMEAGDTKTVLSISEFSDMRVLVLTPEPTALVDNFGMIKTFKEKLSNPKSLLLINKVQDENEGKTVFNRIKNASEKWLDTDIDYLGSIRDDYKVREAVKRSSVYVELFPDCMASEDVRETANAILGL
jgi:flagellar biosynthesis protein FlhG